MPCGDYSSMVSMRRVPAILLVFLFSFSLIGPALLVDDQANLPACCRRDGKHHCGMVDGGMADAPSPGPAVAAVRVKCPLFPGAGVFVARSGAALVTAVTAVAAPIDGCAPRAAQAHCGYCIGSRFSHRQRGPPRFLSYLS